MAEPVRARRLTDQEGQRLQQIVRRGKHESVRVRRAMIIMASASGTLVPAIARPGRRGAVGDPFGLEQRRQARSSQVKPGKAVRDRVTPRRLPGRHYLRRRDIGNKLIAFG